MTKNSVWEKAQTIQLQVADSISSQLDIYVDKKIPMHVKKELISFIKWFESNYCIPITLIVDFEYKHYLITRTGKRVGYIFYWSDFSSYPVFDDIKNIPQIRIPARIEHSTIEEILTSFIEAITDYYAWICNEIYEEYQPNEKDAEEILNKYLQFCE